MKIMSVEMCFFFFFPSPCHEWQCRPSVEYVMRLGKGFLPLNLAGFGLGRFSLLLGAEIRYAADVCARPVKLSYASRTSE